MNLVVLNGRLTADVELKHTQSGMAMASFSIAVDRGKDKNGEDKGADFPHCIAFGKTAENLANNNGKGSKILVQGRIQTSYYEKNGTRIYSTDVISDRIEFLDGKKRSDIPPGFYEEEDPPF